MNFRQKIKRRLPWPARYLYQKIYYAPRDLAAVFGFIFHSTKSPTKFSERLGLVGNFYKISYKVSSPHTEHELLKISRRILDLGPEVPGAIVEAGAFYGGSTSKLSLVARLADRELHVFDSFEGMPENEEEHGKSIYGREHHFPKGSHAVGLEIVKNNVSSFGNISVCYFHKGFFSETLPEFKEPVAAACMNVDLELSTRDCLRYLYPLLSQGGIIFSQDGHFPWIIKLLQDENFWRNDLGVQKPRMEGLGSSKLVTIRPR